MLCYEQSVTFTLGYYMYYRMFRLHFEFLQLRMHVRRVNRLRMHAEVPVMYMYMCT